MKKYRLLIFILFISGLVYAQTGPRLIVRGDDMGYAIHHIGYEDVALDRQGVTDTWTSDKVKAAIKEYGVELISYKDLKKHTK